MTSLTREFRRAFLEERSLGYLALPVILTTVVAFWEFVLGRFPEVQFFFPKPSTILGALSKPAPHAPQLFLELHTDVIATMAKVIAGLVLGFASGVPIGLAMARSELVRWLVDPYITIINSLPRIAMVPVLVLWLGFGPLPGLILVWSAVFVVAALNTYGGVVDIDKRFVDHVRVMGARGLQIIRLVLLPGILPWLVSALRLSLGYAWTVAILAETFGAQVGLGHLIVWYAGQAFAPGVFFTLFLITFIALVLEQTTERFERKVRSWQS